MGNFRNLLAYKKAFELAVDIHNTSKNFPSEERYALIDQMRRSSRSVCANLGEGYRKRKYPKHWVAKLTDADMENTETQVWIDFALKFEYIDQNCYQNWIDRSEEVGRLLGSMIDNPHKFR